MYIVCGLSCSNSRNSELKNTFLIPFRYTFRDIIKNTMLKYVTILLVFRNLLKVQKETTVQRENRAVLEIYTVAKYKSSAAMAALLYLVRFIISCYYFFKSCFIGFLFQFFSKAHKKYNLFKKKIAKYK